MREPLEKGPRRSQAHDEESKNSNDRHNAAQEVQEHVHAHPEGNLGIRLLGGEWLSFTKVDLGGDNPAESRRTGSKCFDRYSIG